MKFKLQLIENYKEKEKKKTAALSDLYTSFVSILLLSFEVTELKTVVCLYSKNLMNFVWSAAFSITNVLIDRWKRGLILSQSFDILSVCLCVDLTITAKLLNPYSWFLERMTLFVEQTIYVYGLFIFCRFWTIYCKMCGHTVFPSLSFSPKPVFGLTVGQIENLKSLCA